MRAARMSVKRLDNEGPLPRVTRVRAELLGFLGATGHGHGTPKAVLLGTEKGAEAEIAFTGDRDLVLHRRTSPPYHFNGMRLFAYETSCEARRCCPGCREPARPIGGRPA
jgi:L-serine dehydratase